MKKIICALAVAVGFVSCETSKEKKSVNNDLEDDRVEVLYFHGKQRCVTCRAIEQCASDVVESSFIDELENGSLVFKVVDISTSEGEELADRYEVSWSALFVNKWDNGLETRNDLTNIAFSNAVRNPDSLKRSISTAINTMLK